MIQNTYSQDKIKLLHWNFHGLWTKLPLLTLALAEQKYDVV